MNPTLEEVISNLLYIAASCAFTEDMVSLHGTAKTDHGAAITRVVAELKRLQEVERHHWQILSHVTQKVEGEDRWQTAARYVREREEQMGLAGAENAPTFQSVAQMAKLIREDVAKELLRRA